MNSGFPITQPSARSLLMAYLLDDRDLLVCADAQRPGWSRVDIPDSLGIGSTERMQLGDGLVLAHSRYCPIEDLEEASTIERNSSTLAITLALHGKSGYQGREGSHFHFSQGCTTITHFHRMQGKRCYLAGENVQQLRLLVPAALLHKYGIHHLPDEPQAHQLLFSRSTRNSQQQAQTLLQLSRSRAGNLLDLQIAGLSLLSDCLRLVAPAPSVTQKLRPADEALILRARDIIHQQYASPITLSYLCASVGTNEFKLKQGFRELFGTTAHRMLTHVRMQHAWVMLETGHSVATTAYQTGFAYPSNFSAVFRQYFGMAPSRAFPKSV